MTTPPRSPDGLTAARRRFEAPTLTRLLALYDEAVRAGVTLAAAGEPRAACRRPAARMTAVGQPMLSPHDQSPIASDVVRASFLTAVEVGYEAHLAYLRAADGHRVPEPAPRGYAATTLPPADHWVTTHAQAAAEHLAIALELVDDADPELLAALTPMHDADATPWRPAARGGDECVTPYVRREDGRLVQLLAHRQHGHITLSRRWAGEAMTHPVQRDLTASELRALTALGDDIAAMARRLFLP